MTWKVAVMPDVMMDSCRHLIGSLNMLVCAAGPVARHVVAGPVARDP